MMTAMHGFVSGLVTLVLMATFVAIWVWAWRPRHRPTFEALAGLPLEDLRDGDGTRDAGPTGAAWPALAERQRPSRPVQETMTWR